MRGLGIRIFRVTVLSVALAAARHGTAQGTPEWGSTEDPPLVSTTWPESEPVGKVEAESISVVPALMYMQPDNPPAASPSPVRRATSPATRRSSAPRGDSSEMLRLLRGPTASQYHSELAYSAPNMLGKFFDVPASMMLGNDFQMQSSELFADIPLAGSCGQLDIADNNKPVTMDRVYCLYNHFQNAIEVEDLDFPGFGSQRFSVDRYTLGFEKAFLDGQWSIELRLPVSGRMEYSGSSFLSGVAGGNMGNLAVLMKRMVYETEETAVAVGLGIDTPTGEDATVQLIEHFFSFRMNNNAVHLIPYVGFLRTPGRLFYQGFFNVNVPTNENRIDYLSGQTIIRSETLGSLTEQTLMHMDFSGGYWLYRNTDALWLTGLATVAEIHYTTTLNDTDVVYVTRGPFFFEDASFQNRRNQLDAVNMTIGLHADVANHTACRVGAVFPLRSGLDRTFDAEVQVQLERRF